MAQYKERFQFIGSIGDYAVRVIRSHSPTINMTISLGEARKEKDGSWTAIAKPGSDNTSWHYNFKSRKEVAVFLRERYKG